MRRTALVVMTMVVPALAAAHPGHGVGGGSQSLVHYLTEPMHGLGAVLGLLALVIGTAYLLRRS